MREEEPMYYPPAQTFVGEKGDLLDKIRPDEIVETIRNKLRGMEFINGSWVQIPALKERALTERGAWDIANLMLSVSSKNVSISNLKDDEIKKRTKAICLQAQLMCLKNWKEYGINGSDQLGFVNEIILSNTFITLKQAQSEGTRKMIMGTVHENRSHAIQEEKSRRHSWIRR